MSWQQFSTSSVVGSFADGDLKIEVHTWEIDGCGDETNTLLRYKGEIIWNKQLGEFEGSCSAKFSEDGHKLCVTVAKRKGGESTEEIDIGELLFKKGLLATQLTVARIGEGQVACTLTSLGGIEIGKIHLPEDATIGDLRSALGVELSVDAVGNIALPSGKLLKDALDADSLTEMLES